jgi:5'-nucleotidase
MYPNGSALDITAPPAPPMQYQPAPVAVQPVYDTSAQPVSYASAAGGRYTVKKGDTLWKIAETKYGNGNQWQKIASANPGLSAETLKAGQTIAVP